MFDPLTIALEVDGRSINPDEYTSGIVEILGSTIKMLAHEHAWFDGDEIVLPTCTQSGPDQVAAASDIFLLGAAWGLWERGEGALRTFGGHLVSSNESVNTPEGAKEMIVFRLSPDVRPHLRFLVASERMRRMHERFYVDVVVSGAVAHRVKRLADGPVPLPPTAFVSEMEAYAVLAITETLFVPVTADPAPYLGLTLVEWVRCFAVLQEFTKERRDDGPLVAWKHAEGLALLASAGILEVSARRFVENITFGKGSTDLFDAPMIRADGQWWIFAPALWNAHIPRIVLSAISSGGAQVKYKGPAFERWVVKQFSDAGITCKPMKFNRDGDEYLRMSTRDPSTTPDNLAAA
ncbi:MAG: hypothetical protein P3A28_06960 [Gemmatimonadota bacterium]|nr:hypothetical protein [Gemmatimonadota bacterium]